MLQRTENCHSLASFGDCGSTCDAGAICSTALMSDEQNRNETELVPWRLPMRSAEKIAAENDLTKAQAKSIVDSVFKAIADAAASGAETSLPGSASSRSGIAPRVRPQSVDRRND